VDLKDAQFEDIAILHQNLLGQRLRMFVSQTTNQIQSLHKLTDE
jgi:hypothetical protein